MKYLVAQCEDQECWLHTVPEYTLVAVGAPAEIVQSMTGVAEQRANDHAVMFRHTVHIRTVFRQ